MQIAIDDFGTGYSSLAYLKKLPVDVLKIDKSFVDYIPDQRDDREIVSTIIAMAKNLGMKVLAKVSKITNNSSFFKVELYLSSGGIWLVHPYPRMNLNNC